MGSFPLGRIIWQKQESSWLGLWRPDRLTDVKTAHEITGLTLETQKSKTWFLTQEGLNFLGWAGGRGVGAGVQATLSGSD